MNRRHTMQERVELETEDVFQLERCLHFRECYVQASMQLRSEDVPVREVSSFQRVLCTGPPHTTLPVYTPLSAGFAHLTSSSALRVLVSIAMWCECTKGEGGRR